MARMTAAERRECVIRAAITEFSRGGYHGTPTAVIARRVGVSQPYLFRLFPTKQDMFLEAVSRCLQEIRVALLEAAAGAPEEERHRVMAEAYRELMTDPEKLLMQLQIYVSVAAAEAAGDLRLGEAIRARWLELWDDSHIALSADTEETTYFIAHGMLINALVAMGFPTAHRVWSGFALLEASFPIVPAVASGH
ncbi:TetR/AcrR family transcriptional regulator [Streptomyces hainanensis]|uniref:TetR/AcrR family transcriptional regulator n=1 Tax=Streptomyces hainanensis TaxID=402648 RepID=A0A4R4TH76_9ACTN|nr:TetR/AcrR family transcriptional regulator [Streptomyces hainanensis]TDC73689.1 TetR/AcrR family transcriptional regulator [Streptomyces hainanensis]